MIVDDYLECERIARVELVAYLPNFNSTENVRNAIDGVVSKCSPTTAVFKELQTVLQEKV